MSNNKEKNLYYLHELDSYKVKSDYPDVRGWYLKDENSKTLGKVDNLLVNKNTERVVYLDVEVDKDIISKNHKPYSNKAGDGAHEILNEEGENHLIVPIGLVTLDNENHIVNSTSINHQTFSETKRHRKHEIIDRHYEITVLDSYNRDQDNEYPDDDSLYSREEYNAK